MSHPKSKPHDRRAAAATTPASREEIARTALVAGRFREAVEGFKDLIKTERRTEWVESLAQAYAGRAGDLQAKGMIAEALTIWRNRATACGKPLAAPAYIDCLCLSGASGEAFKLLTAINDPSERAAIEIRLAATALFLPAEALSALPSDRLLRRHHGSAVAALHAYCAGESGALDAALSEIPFRSPYRDLRPTLKAITLAPFDPAQANELLARVGKESPFAKLASVARVAALSDDEWLPALAGLDDAQQQVLLDLKGCPQAQRPRLIELAKLGKTPAPEKALAIFLRAGAPQSPSTDALCRHLIALAPGSTREISAYVDRLSSFESSRLTALNAELTRRGDPHSVHWLKAVRALGKTGDDSKNAAMILQRLALGNTSTPSTKKLSAQAIEWLAQSLERDADNPAGRLHLIRATIQSGELKLARQHLDTALARAPNDTETLLIAVETALASGSHKKAAGLAKQLLELDPINPHVRALIGQAALAQARKQIRAKRPDLAIKELDEAEKWLADSEARRVARVLRGLCADDASATGLLRDAATGFVGPLSAGFCLAMEALRLKMEPRALLDRAGLTLNATPDAADLAQFVQALNACDDKEQKMINQSIVCLRKLIELAASAPMTAIERIAVCDALLRRHEYMALKVHAKAALKESPQQPILVYYAAVAACKNLPWKLPDRDWDKLEAAQERASKAGDLRTAHRIGEFILRDQEWGDDKSPFGWGPDEDDDFDDESPFAGGPFGMDASQMRPMMRAMIQVTGIKRFLDMVRADLGAAAFNAFKAQAGNDDNRLIDLLIDYMLAHGFADQFMPGNFPGMQLKPKSVPKIKPGKTKKSGQKGLFDD